jgi:hypothetical protein
MKAVDKIHEKHRNPCVFYTSKEVWQAEAGRATEAPVA